MKNYKYEHLIGRDIMQSYKYENLKSVVLTQFLALETCLKVNDYQYGVADSVDDYILSHKPRVIADIFSKNQLYGVYVDNLEQFEFLDNHILK